MCVYTHFLIYNMIYGCTRFKSENPFIYNKSFRAKIKVFFIVGENS